MFLSFGLIAQLFLLQNFERENQVMLTSSFERLKLLKYI